MFATSEEELIFLCNLFGSCSKRSQGAGGNISVKDSNNLYIKASGVRLTSVNKDNGYVVCDLSGVLSLYNKNIELLDSTILFGNPQKPSMEIFLHLLPSKYVVHFHPSYICKFLCSNKSEEIFTKKIFPNSLYIPYLKPGILLAKEIHSKWTDESVLFLENHGIVLLSNTLKSIVFIYENIIQTLEKFTQIPNDSSSIVSHYLLTLKSGKYIKPVYSIKKLPTRFIPISPDHFLFLQKESLFTNSSELEKDLLIWNSRFENFPSFINLDNQIYACGNSWEDCLNKEEYLLSYLEIVESSSRILTTEEQNLLKNCPKEIFRLHNQ
jgi:ribulose-5-phosphate 4-epimerase/fuculose-1-phosphate aldolase